MLLNRQRLNQYAISGLTIVWLSCSASLVSAQTPAPTADANVSTEGPAEYMAKQQELWTGVYDAYFKKYSKHYFGPFFDWQLFKAQAIAESKLTVDAESWAGAQGIMQIMPATYADIQERNPHFDTVYTPRWNIAAGIYYNQYLYTRLSEVPEPDRMLLTFAAYNAGLGSVYKAQKKAGGSSAWTDIKPYMPRETQGYVERIKLLREYWVLHPGDIPPEVLAFAKKRKAELALREDMLPEVNVAKPPKRTKVVAPVEQLAQPVVPSEPVVVADAQEPEIKISVAERRERATNEAILKSAQEKKANEQRLRAVPAF